MISYTLKTTLAVSLGAILCTSVLAETPKVKKRGDHQVKIINGERAAANSFPFVTALVHRDSNDPSCGASFIGKRYVLTASHCVYDAYAEDLAVVVGEYDTQSTDDGQRIKVAQIYLHEDYDPVTTNNDIAILELESDVSGVEPVSLLTPELEAEIKAGDIMTVIGWGNLLTDGQDFPRYLQQVDVPLYDRAACDTAYQGGITEQMICAGYEQGGKDSCQGDSGGPLLIKRDDQWYQSGVVSFGNGCAAANSPGVYARVSQFLDWVKQKKAGVSYRQRSDYGYVELEYQEKHQFSIKNVGQVPYQVTQIEFANQNGVKNLAVEGNQCDGKQLSFEQSCEFTVNLAADGVSQASLDMLVHTNHPQNNLALHRLRMSVLDKADLDMPSLVGSDSKAIKWYSGGDVVWQAQTHKTAVGDSAVESGAITDQQSSVLLAYVANDRVKDLAFKYLVSSEDGYDGLRLMRNGRIDQAFFATGTEQTEFANHQLTLGEGKDRIAFIYTKDEVDEEAVGDDKAYLDDVVTSFENKAPTVKLSQANVSVQEQQSITLDASTSSDEDGDTISYKWKIDGSSLGGVLTGSDTAKPQFKASKQTGTVKYSVTVTDAYGATSSATGQITVTKKPSGGSFGWLLLMLLLPMSRNRK